MLVLNNAYNSFCKPNASMCTYTWFVGSEWRYWRPLCRPWHYMCSFPRLSHLIRSSSVASLSGWFYYCGSNIQKETFSRQSTHYRRVPLPHAEMGGKKEFVIPKCPHRQLEKVIKNAIGVVWVMLSVYQFSLI